MERSKVCRICINETAMVLSLFGEDALWRKIVAFANVEIRENDPLPQQICTICARDVLSASSLKLKCEDADKYFRRIAEISGLTSTTTPQLEYTEIEIKSEPIDECERTSSVTTTTTTAAAAAVPRTRVSINRARSPKSSVESSNAPGFTSPEPSRIHQTNSPSSSQVRNNIAAKTTFPTMISIPIQRKTADKPELKETPSTKKTIPEQHSPPGKLAPIKLKYSSSTSSAQILSSTTNTSSVADSTILPHSSKPFKKKRSRVIKTSKSADVVKAKKRIKKIGSLSLNNTTIAAASSTVQTNETVSSTKIVEPTSKVSSRRQVVAHQCDICGGRFALKSILKHHMRSCHPDVQTSVQCDMCKRTYSSKIFHDRHIQSGLCRKTDQIEEPPPPEPQYPYNCPHCRRSFPTGRHMGWHKRLSHCFGLMQERVKKKASGTLMTATNRVKRKSLPITEQLSDGQGQVPRRKPISLNRTDNGATFFQWNSPEFTGAGNLSNRSPTSSDKAKLLGCEKEQDELITKTESNENVDNNNTNTLLEPSNLQQARSARPQKLPKKLNNSYKLRKTRKPYVFMDEVKFEQAKIIVANGGGAAELAQQLNISLITAWRVRQCVVKNVPLKFRRKREGQSNVDSNKDGGLNLSAEGLGISAEALKTFDETKIKINNTGKSRIELPKEAFT